MADARLTLVIASLAAGGAERVLSVLANHWVGRKRTVTIITMSGARTAHYELDAAVRRIGVGADERSQWFGTAVVRKCGGLVKLRRAIRASRPDLVISFGDRTNVRTLLATRGLGLRVIVSERSNPELQPLGRTWEPLRALSYGWADGFVAQTDAVADWLRRLAGRNVPVRTIPNPVEPTVAASAGGEGGWSAILGQAEDRPVVVAVGRLAEQKGFDLLIQTFAALAGRHPTWRLVILGEGAEREALEALVARLGLTGRVFLPGRVKDPRLYMARAELFVLSSRWEGFPNALLEAMGAGLPVVAFDCQHGPSLIVRDGIDGLLVPAGDVPGLEGAMDRLMRAPEERRRLGSRGPDVLQRFSVASVAAAWEDLFAQVAAAGPHDGQRSVGRVRARTSGQGH